MLSTARQDDVPANVSQLIPMLVVLPELAAHENPHAEAMVEMRRVNAMGYARKIEIWTSQQIASTCCLVRNRYTLCVPQQIVLHRTHAGTLYPYS